MISQAKHTNVKKVYAYLPTHPPTNGWMGNKMDRWTDEWMDGQTDGSMAQGTDGLANSMDGNTNGWMCQSICPMIAAMVNYVCIRR